MVNPKHFEVKRTEPQFHDFTHYRSAYNRHNWTPRGLASDHDI